MKLWEKGISTDKLVEEFTAGKDRQLDMYLAPFDILGSIAHASMLKSIGLLTDMELSDLKTELGKLYVDAREGRFIIENDVEDVHSQVELMLTRRLGDTGKKIHTARSRNDQVLVDLKLFIREELMTVARMTYSLFSVLKQQSEKYKDYIIPGYTHMQVAMPSSFGLWFGAFAESLTDDMQLLLAAYKIANQNPLGSAAGYGSSFPIDRKMTTELLGFDDLNYNVMYAQMSRGKTERITSFALASLASTISRLSNDVCLFTSQNFGFIRLPDEITTGSSIMPHKKNPDVFELLRGKCNRLQALPEEIDHISGNLFSGYSRDYQVIKESFLPSFEVLKNIIEVARVMISKINPVRDVEKKDIYKYMYSVEEVNKLVIEGVPFREAYRVIAEKIKNGDFGYENLPAHTHQGSIGNLANDSIELKMDRIFSGFNFKRAEEAINKLIE